MNTQDTDTQKKNDNQTNGNLEELVKAASSLGMPYLKEVPKIDKEALNIISKDVAKQHNIIAFEKNKNTT